MWALNATPAGGRVELKLTRHAARARLSVTDGRGVSRPAVAGEPPTAPPPLPGDLPHPRGTETPLDPMELRSTLERQGGSFHIEPPAAQQGMRYVLELPLRAVSAGPPAHHELPQPGAADTPQQALQGLSVLVIDDNADARESLAMLLSSEGGEVLSFGSGRDALAWLASRPTVQWPGLMVCDIVLDDEDGHAVMHQVRRLEDERRVPLEQRMPAVALTGLSQPGDRVRALMAGFQEHLVKPVEPEALVRSLHALAGRGIDTSPGDLPPPGPLPPPSPRQEMHR